MKKRKNKIILIIALLLVSIPFFSFVKNILHPIDRNSYFSLVEGTAKVNEKELKTGKKVVLRQADILATGSQSFGIIEWGDGSITRLGENTKLQIHESYVNDDRTVIQIFFQIFSGKTWSNVLSYVPEESYFYQSYEDTEIAVRGTVFILDADNDYVFVEKHKIDILRDGKLFSLFTKQAYDFKNDIILSLQDFVKYFRDVEFFHLNSKLDSELLLRMKQELIAGYDKKRKELEALLAKLGTSYDKKTFNNLLASYQDMHFLDQGTELFDDKVFVKEQLIQSSKEAKLLADSYFFDYIAVLEERKTEKIQSMTDFIIANKQKFSSEFVLNYLTKIDIQSYINKELQKEVIKMKEAFGLGIEIGGKFVDGINYLDNEARKELYTLKAEMEKSVQNTLKTNIKKGQALLAEQDLAGKIEAIVSGGSQATDDLFEQGFYRIQNLRDEASRVIQKEGEAFIRSNILYENK